MKRIWALVPIKDFNGAKSRLMAALSAAERRALALAMARDVVSALAATPGIERVCLVSDIADLPAQLGIAGICHFDTQKARGLNADLTLAAAWASEQGASHALITHADLPLLTAAAIARFIAPEPGDQITSTQAARAAADKAASGTNLLLAPLPLPFPLVFGTNSLARFQAASHSAGHPLTLHHDPALAADIDEPADLTALLTASAQGKPTGHATATLLQSLLAQQAAATA